MRYIPTTIGGRGIAATIGGRGIAAAIGRKKIPATKRGREIVLEPAKTGGREIV